jgi:ribosomal protein S18 acetylase RimI-like enzyme
VVVGADNAAAIGLYNRAGFTSSRAFEMHKGTMSVLMETAVSARPRRDERPGP